MEFLMTKTAAAPSKEGEHHENLPATLSLGEAFAQLRQADECERFLRDLCTPAEIRAFEERWLAAQLLHRGTLSYRDIHALTGISTTTIGRVARFLFEEPYHGYQFVLRRLRKKLGIRNELEISNDTLPRGRHPGRRQQ
jgi:TrpR-related protein YerC/YecD